MDKKTEDEKKDIPNNNKNFNPNSSITLYELFDVPTRNKFRNPNYILKFSNQSNLKFIKDELTIKYSGKGYNLIDYATVQSNYSISKADPIFYFEIEIIDEGSKKDITIGFSDKEFVLNKQCGVVTKSFGYNGDGKKIREDSKESFGPKFKKNDIIGCGFYFSKNSIFYTYNGKFLDYAFKNIPQGNYYATVSLHSLNECVKVNFGKNNFAFDIEGFYLENCKSKMNDIIKEDTSLRDLDYIIREYLIHSGYQETFNAIETTSPMENLDMKNLDNEKLTNKMDIEEEIGKEKEKEEDEQYQKLRKFSSQEEEPLELRKRSLSFMLEQVNDEPNKNIFKIMNFLQERKIIQNMINQREYDSAIEYFTKNFLEYSTKNNKIENYKKIMISLTTMKYFQQLDNNDYMKAFEILNNLDRSYWNENLNISLYGQNEQIFEMNVEKLSMLICYQNIKESEYSFLLSPKQIDFLSNQVNSLILDMIGLSNESILEKILKSQKLINYTYSEITNSPGEEISIKIS